MKKTLLSSLLAFNSFLFCFAQVTDELGNQHILRQDGTVEVLTNDKSIYTGSLTAPFFLGGKKKLDAHIAEFFSYPKDKTYAATIRFLVEEDGEITHPFVFKSSGSNDFDRAALEYVTNMPEWKPAIVYNKEVRCYQQLVVDNTRQPIVRMAKKSSDVPISDEDNKNFVNASFKAGDKEMFKWLSMNIKYPATCRENNEQGKVVLQLTIEKSGEISDIEVIKSSGYELLDNEAIRVVEFSSKLWKAATLYGQEVVSLYTLPVVFKLEG